MQKRLGFIGITLADRKKSASAVNGILSEYGETIVARMGFPYRDRKCSVITLVIDATTDQIGALCGKLGGLPGVTVKSACTQ